MWKTNNDYGKIVVQIQSNDSKFHTEQVVVVVVYYTFIHLNYDSNRQVQHITIRQ